MTDEQCQETIHAVLTDALRTTGILPDDALLTGWTIAFEHRQSDDISAGECHGPATLTSWNAIGLLEWARLCINERIQDDD